MSSETQCGRCGAPVEEGALFCSKCGVDVTMVSDGEETLAMTTDGTPVSPVRSTMRQMLREATLGEYEVLNELGRGGMATVFLAHDIALDRKVAIKVMSSHLLEGEGMAERFKLEARTAAKLSHPHIIPIYAVKESSDTLFFVMKFIEGRALDEIIQKIGPLPIPMVKDILTKVGSALGYAHRRDVVHRDVKPGNIMVDEEGTPIVTDFGIAKVASATGLTMTGTTIGTPSYMSPEQCQSKGVTGASDQYSLGIVAFQMLTGKLPFEGDSAVTTMFKHCNEELPPLADFRPDCPPEVIDTVNRMVAKNPADRWPSLEAAVQKLGGDSTSSSVDAITSQLVQAAKDGDLELLARLSTGGQTVPGKTASQPAEGAGAGRKRVPLMVGVAVAFAAVVGTLAIAQPWVANDAAENLDEGAAASLDPAEVAEQAGVPDGGGDSASTVADGGDPPSQPVVAGDATSEPAGPTPTPENAPATVPQRRVAAVRVTGPAGPLEPGDQVVFTATVTDPDDAAIPASVITACQDHGWSRCGYAWDSDDDAVVRVAEDGRVTAISPGQAEIGVTVGGVRGTQRVTVAQASVSRVDIVPPSLSLTEGETASLSARIYGRQEVELTGRSVFWSSSDASIARVASDGSVVAAGRGRATITATAGAIGTTATVDVAPAPVDTRTAISDLIASYARALESRDIAQVRRVYPGLTDRQERDLSGALAFMEGLRAVLTVDSFEDQGTTATAQVSGTYSFTADGRAQQAPVSFLAVFENGPAGWRLTETRPTG